MMRVSLSHFKLGLILCFCYQFQPVFRDERPPEVIDLSSDDDLGTMTE
jgi:hypothetical protein